MTAMFPGSGVPAADAKNTIANPNILGNCDPLWYSTSRCQPRFDPAAANAMLSEMLNAVNCAGIPYDCSKLDNLCTAILTMIRDGHSNCIYLAGGPLDYTGGLNPPLLAYPADCCMMLKAIPNVTNNGPVRINVNGLGFVPVLRNDGANLQPFDFRAGIPQLLVYCNGAFFVPYILSSQVPIFLTDTLVLWVRPDGSDLTGDGSANSAAKAFRTIQHAFDIAGNRFAASNFGVNIQLGIPGDYEGAMLSSAITRITITGDPAAPQNYRIMSKIIPGFGGYAVSLFVARGAYLLNGVTLFHSGNGPGPALTAQGGAELVLVGWNRIELGANMPAANMFSSDGGSSTYFGGSSRTDFVGNNHTAQSAIGLTKNTIMWRGDPTHPVTVNFTSIQFLAYAFGVTDLSTLDFDSATVTTPGCTGIKHFVDTNSILRMAGQPEPGNAAGSEAHGGQFIP